MVRVILILFTSVSMCIFGQDGWQCDSSPTGDGLHDVFFLNDSLGWAYTYGTGIVIHTCDGGQSWQIQTQLDSLYFEHIQFTDKNHGWLCGEYGTVYKTTNGGMTWIDMSPNVPGRILHNAEGSEGVREGWQVLYYNMYFFNNDEGFVTGIKMNQQEKKQEVLFFMTDDGGGHWLPVQEAPKEMLFWTVFLNRQKGFTTGGGTIFQSTDRGRTWASVYAGKRDQLRGLFFLNEEMGWACGFSGRILRTTDGGRNWEEIQVTKNRLRSIAFIDEKNGFVVGDHNAEDGVLYRSDDGGRTWEKCESDYPDLHRLFVTPDKTWIVGKEGTILTLHNTDVR